MELESLVRWVSIVNIFLPVSFASMDFKQYTLFVAVCKAHRHVLRSHSRNLLRIQ